MNNKQNIIPRNENGQPHGYWEVYHSSGQLRYKGHYVNGILIDYFEYNFLNKKRFILR